MRLRHVNIGDYGPEWIVDDAVLGLRGGRNETNRQPNKRQPESSVLLHGNVCMDPRESPLHWPSCSTLSRFQPHRTLVVSTKSWLRPRPTKAIPQPRLPPKKVSIFQTWPEGTDKPTYSKPHRVPHNGPKEAGSSRTAIRRAPGLSTGL